MDTAWPIFHTRQEKITIGSKTKNVIFPEDGYWQCEISYDQLPALFILNPTKGRIIEIYHTCALSLRIDDEYDRMGLNKLDHQMLLELIHSENGVTSYRKIFPKAKDLRIRVDESSKFSHIEPLVDESGYPIIDPDTGIPEFKEKSPVDYRELKGEFMCSIIFNYKYVYIRENKAYPQVFVHECILWHPPKFDFKEYDSNKDFSKIKVQLLNLENSKLDKWE